MNLSCIIIDDEYLAIKVLEEYSSKIDELSILKTFTDPKEALLFLQQTKVDLLFLDIQMPYLDGFELLKQLPSPPLIIFTTARHDFAVKAFELDVLDYLVKPISSERFEKAVGKADEYLQLLAGRKSEKKNYIMVRADYQITKISVEDILF
ncbi:MAG: response regulator, partial [Chryseolinea sp.]